MAFPTVLQEVLTCNDACYWQLDSGHSTSVFGANNSFEGFFTMSCIDIVSKDWEGESFTWNMLSDPFWHHQPRLQ